MPIRVYLDTELVMAFLFDRSEFAAELEALINIMSDETLERYCSVFCIDRIYHIASRREGGDDAFRAVVTRFMRFVEPLDVDVEDIMSAVNSGMRDFEKAVMLCSAGRKGAGIVLSLTEKGYGNPPMPIMTPLKFLNTDH